MKRLFFFISIFVLSLTYFACSKFNEGKPSVKETDRVLGVLRAIQIKTHLEASNSASRLETGIENFNVENNQNPYEWVGIAHNQSLEYVSGYMTELLDTTSSLQVNIKQPASNEVITVSVTDRPRKIVALTTKFFNEEVLPHHSIGTTNLTAEFEREQAMEAINYFSANKYVNPHVSGIGAYQENIWNKLTHFSSLGRISPFEASVDSIIIAKVMSSQGIQESLDIVKVAESIILQAEIDEKERARQLVFLSILRNSIAYWAGVIQDTNHPWWQLNGEIWAASGAQNAKWNWGTFWSTLLVGVADAVGAVGASAGLASVGVVEPYTVAAVGGVVGAACSAAVDALLGDE